MSKEQPRVGYCPNCGLAAIQTGNEVACEVCDVVYTVSEKKAAVVSSLGIEDRFKRIEDKVFAEPKPKPKPKPKDEDEEEPGI